MVETQIHVTKIFRKLTFFNFYMFFFKYCNVYNASSVFLELPLGAEMLGDRLFPGVPAQSSPHCLARHPRANGAHATCEPACCEQAEPRPSARRRRLPAVARANKIRSACKPASAVVYWQKEYDLIVQKG